MRKLTETQLRKIVREQIEAEMPAPANTDFRTMVPKRGKIWDIANALAEWLTANGIPSRPRYTRGGYTYTRGGGNMEKDPTVMVACRDPHDGAKAWKLLTSIVPAIEYHKHRRMPGEWKTTEEYVPWGSFALVDWGEYIGNGIGVYTKRGIRVS